MAIKTFTAKQVFVEGRGSVSEAVCKSDADVIHEESELVQEGMEPTPKGADAMDHGNMPIFATGPQPFHTGRGNGRGS